MDSSGTSKYEPDTEQNDLLGKLRKMQELASYRTFQIEAVL